MSYSITQWLFVFYFYCFFGWCFESTYVSLKKKRFVNRGFIRGPFLPLYGTGAVMLLVVSVPFGDMAHPYDWIWTYIAGCIGATILEYVTGVVMEALFKVKYWDYSMNKFNFQGHICLSSSLAWGALTILVTEVIHKPVAGFILSIPTAVLTVVTFVLTAVIGADFALSFKAALDLRDVLMKLDKVREDIEHVQKRVDVIIALTNEDLSKRREDLAEELAEFKTKYRIHLADKERLMGIKDFFQRDMIRSNPTMVSRYFGEALKEIQEKLEEQIEEQKQKNKENKGNKKK